MKNNYIAMQKYIKELEDINRTLHSLMRSGEKIGKELEAQLDNVRGQVIELKTREFVLEKHLVEATDECPKCYAGIIISNGFLVCPECDWTEE